MLKTLMNVIKMYKFFLKKCETTKLLCNYVWTFDMLVLNS